MTAPEASSTILVVDDDRDSREIAARLLERAGYRARRAESGAECLRVVAAERIDLILLDVMMPEMDGFAVCAALAERGYRIPVILLTAKDDSDTRLEGMHHGVAEFLTKPINRVELFARVRAQLHILELGRQLERVEENLQSLRRPGDPGAPLPRR
ncbi:MAG TPA: response regulator [Candidatus Binatia bacterium]|nr:response regulator [Candidatus Binatia bacterium]